MGRTGAARAAGGRRQRHGASRARWQLQQALESVHAQYSDLLESFDGNAARFEGARSLLEVCFQQQYRGRKRRVRLSPTAQALTVLILLALGTWMFSAFRARSRWNAYVAALRSEPGIVVVSSGREGGQFVVSGLRDPLAQDPRRCWPRTASPPMTLPGAGNCIRRFIRRW